MLSNILNELVNKVFNEGFAWLSVGLGGILTLKYIARKSVIKSKDYKKFFIKLNKYMRNTHIYLGVLLIITGFIHGVFSSQDVFTINLGTACWVVSILLGISWAIRKILKKPGSWIKYHRALTVVFILTLGLHLFDIKIYRFSRLINNLQANVEEHVPKDLSKDNGENKESISEIDGDLSNYTFQDGTYEGIMKAVKDALLKSANNNN